MIPDAVADLPEAVTRTITLPESVSEEGVTNSAEGLETANAARERGPESGLEIADAARENRASFFRGDDAIDLAPDTPDVPEIPDVPTEP